MSTTPIIEFDRVSKMRLIGERECPTSGALTAKDSDLTLK